MFELISEKQKVDYERFLEFADKYIREESFDWEKSQSIPPEVIALCAEEGYLGGMLPCQYGGLGWDTVTFGLFNEALGGASVSLSGLFNVHNMVEHSILRWGTEEQKLKWLPVLAKGEKLAAFALTEPVAGSDINGIETSFTRTESGFILNGTKRWITFGGIADVYLVFGKMEGKPLAVLVERENSGLNVIPVKDMLGFRSAHLAVLEFQDCYLSEENIIAKPGFAFSHVAPYSLEYGRISVAMGSLAILRSCIQECSDQVLKRKTFSRMLIQHASINEMFTQMCVDYEASKFLCIQACKAKDNRDWEASGKVLQAKYFTSKAAVKHSAAAIQIMGAKGFNESSIIARNYRDAKAMEIIEGSSQIIEMLLGSGFANKYGKSVKAHR